MAIPLVAHPSAESAQAARILGCILGGACANAVGTAASESRLPGYVSYSMALPGKTRLELIDEFGATPKFGFALTAHDDEERVLLSGRWGPDYDQATLILLGFVDHNELDERDFVRRLHDWQQMGIKEVGGEVPAHNAIIPYSNGEVHSLTPWKLSELDPFADALRYWKANARSAATNGSTMRAGVLGAITYLYPEELVVHTTVNFTSVSHADPRCALTTALLALVTAHVVNGSYKGEETIKHALSLVSNYLIQRDPPLDYAAVVDLSDWLCAEDLSELDLDSGLQTYTYKACAVAIWALRQAFTVLPTSQVLLSPPEVRQRLFVHLITEVIMHGGDAEGNAMVAGNILGAYFGPDGLPPHWRQGLRSGDWLSGKVNQACALLGLFGPLAEGDTDASDAPICPAQDARPRL